MSLDAVLSMGPESRQSANRPRNCVATNCRFLAVVRDIWT